MSGASPLRVLVVEDEFLIALELELLLQDDGHELVGFAADSAEALALAEALKPDLALVDVHLSDGPTGIDLARRLCFDLGTAAVFMTANAKRIPDDFAGAAGVIAKPYTARGFRDAVGYIARQLAGAAWSPPPGALTLSPAFIRARAG